MAEISGIHHVSVTVTDIERSVPSYSDRNGHGHDNRYDDGPPSAISDARTRYGRRRLW
jgi:hypothetical protein